MKIHADLSQRAVVNSHELPWVDSPLPGVQRRLLERDGDEVARATSIVRYAPNSCFSPHTHGGGEEFLVLAGTFSDETGDFPQGMYVRNPVGSSHKPFTREGTTILVKLRQFDPEDKACVRVDTNRGDWLPGPVAGIEILPLHEFASERVALQRWQPGIHGEPHSHSGGEEIFVLSGSLSDEFGSYPQGTWLRNPAGSAHAPYSKDGCLLYVKTGHL